MLWHAAGLGISVGMYVVGEIDPSQIIGLNGACVSEDEVLATTSNPSLTPTRGVRECGVGDIWVGWVGIGYVLTSAA